jgi:hypothetical protein
MILPDADPKEIYKVPNDESGVTIGETNVYYLNVKTGLDPKTYKRVGFSYYKDKNKALYRDYEEGSPVFVEVKGADVATFVGLDWLYQYGSEYWDILSGADNFGADSLYVYYEGRRIQGSDAATFRFIRRYYTKDKNQVYYEGKVIPDADPQTFHCIDEHGFRWMDKRNTFEHGKKVSRLKKMEE